MNLDISVALATYNGSKYIEEQLLSLVNQSITPKEIIVVDDFSTDGTLEIVQKIKKKYSFITVYKNSQNLGPIQTFKNAIAYCSCDYVALCDQDDIWYGNKLELSLKAIDKSDSCPSIVFSDLEMINTDGSLLQTSFWQYQAMLYKNFNFKQLLVSNFVTGCTILMNKKMKDEIKLMPDNVLMHDHWIALIAFGFGNFNIINNVTVKYREHSNSVTNKLNVSFSFRLYMFIYVFFDFKRKYLSNYILQVELFFNLYKSRLGENEIRFINNILKLRNSNSIIRKINVFFFKKISFNEQKFKQKIK